MLVDSHAHLEGPRFDADRAQTIQRALDAGVAAMLTVGQVGESFESLAATFALAEQHPFLIASVGLHPHDARFYSADVGKEMLRRATHPKVVAWGECGLDFYYDNSPRDVQIAAFRDQLRLAREADLPVIVHSRDAADETLEILSMEWRGSRRAIVFHCFSYDDLVASRAAALGSVISFSGIVTFKNAQGVREAATNTPLDSILVETDCPFLAPVPHRGKRNEPAFVVEVAREIAALRGISEQEVHRATTATFRRVFLTARTPHIGGNWDGSGG